MGEISFLSGGNWSMAFRAALDGVAAGVYAGAGD